MIALSPERQAELLADFKRREAERKAAWEASKELTKKQKQEKADYYERLRRPFKSRVAHLCERCGCMMETGTQVIRRKTFVGEFGDWKLVAKYRHAKKEECHA